MERSDLPNPEKLEIILQELLKPYEQTKKSIDNYLKATRLIMDESFKSTKEAVDLYSEFMELLFNPNMWNRDINNLNMDYFNYLNLAFGPRKPLDWATRNEIVHREQTMLLRHFTHPNITAKYPVIIIPPQAGHDSKIADYNENQSLVRVFQNNGFDVFVTEWLSAEKKDSELGIADYIRFTDSAVEKVKKLTCSEKVHMVGQCQGGWQSAMYASLYPQKIAGMVIAAAPIDFNADRGFLNLIVEEKDMTFFRELVNEGGGLMTGKAMIFGFKAMQPIEHYFLKYLRELNMVLKHDGRAIERHIQFERWYENPQNLPGKFYLEAVEYVFKKNCLANPGLFQIDGRPIDLRNITNPLVLMGGKNDHITLPGQVFGMRKLVGTDQSKIIEILSDGGHIGTLMGSKSLRENWPEACNFLKKSENA